MGGVCNSRTEEDKHSSRLHEQLIKERKADDKVKKLLLLGAGGSGKSTFFKQLQDIHGKGFDDKDRLSFKNHVYHQIIEQMKRLISVAREFSEEFPEKYSDCKVK